MTYNRKRIQCATIQQKHLLLNSPESQKRLFSGSNLECQGGRSFFEMTGYFQFKVSREFVSKLKISKKKCQSAYKVHKIYTHLARGMTWSNISWNSLTEFCSSSILHYYLVSELTTSEIILLKSTDKRTRTTKTTKITLKSEERALVNSVFSCCLCDWWYIIYRHE